MTQFLEREPYERSADVVNHRNGSYERSFTMKKIGDVEVKIPRDRMGEFKTKV
ncbi:transposase [bacterium]|nr:transposase [bacterium]